MAKYSRNQWEILETYLFFYLERQNNLRKYPKFLPLLPFSSSSNIFFVLAHKLEWIQFEFVKMDLLQKFLVCEEALGIKWFLVIFTTSDLSKWKGTN